MSSLRLSVWGRFGGRGLGDWQEIDCFAHSGNFGGSSDKLLVANDLYEARQNVKPTLVPPKTSDMFLSWSGEVSRKEDIGISENYMTGNDVIRYFIKIVLTSKPKIRQIRSLLTLMPY